MEDDAAKQHIREAVVAVLDAVLDVMYYTPHEWHTLPCEVCRTITATLGKPFGCHRYAADPDWPRKVG